MPPFQQLLDRNRRDVLAYLISMVGPDEADDCFQETFLSALRAYPDLRDGANLRGWLFTIAHRKALDSRRRLRRQPIPSGPPKDLESVAVTIAGAVDGRSSRTDEQLDPGALWTAVDQLPPKQRAAVTLRFTADLSHREIARAIDCSEAAARRSLHEGLKRLREEWT